MELGVPVVNALSSCEQAVSDPDLGEAQSFCLHQLVLQLPCLLLFLLFLGLLSPVHVLYSRQSLKQRLGKGSIQARLGRPVGVLMRGGPAGGRGGMRGMTRGGFRGVRGGMMRGALSMRGKRMPAGGLMRGRGFASRMPMRRGGRYRGGGAAGRGGGGMLRGGRGGVARGRGGLRGRGGFAGRGGRGRGRGRGSGRPAVTREQLDNQLDAYMSKTKGHLDAELDAYMAQADPDSME